MSTTGARQVMIGRKMRPLQSRAHDQLVVMVVEDEFVIRMMIAEELRRCGYDVIECATADEALEILRAGVQVNVIFSDVRMPGDIDGARLSQVVAEEFPAIAFVLTSAQIPPDAEISVCFVPKPYVPEDVIAVISTLTGTSD